jgi:hypothetical protein
MKTKLLLTLIITISLSFSLKTPPTALNLSNHFGAASVNSPYNKVDQNEIWVQNNIASIMPGESSGNKNLKTQVKELPIKSGEVTNIAPESSKLISPSITGPKLKVQTEFNYSAPGKVNEFLGFETTMKQATLYDKATGEIIKDNIAVSGPKYISRDAVVPVTKSIDHYIDLKSGESLNKDTQLKTHGIDRPEPMPELHGK